MKCIHCGDELTKDAKYCNKCGKTLNAETKGIGGLLSFFLFSIFVSILINIYAGISDISSISGMADLANSWRFGLIIIDVLYFGGLIVFSIYTILAFSKFKSNAVSLGKMFLSLIFISNLLSVIYSLLTGVAIASETSLIDSGQMVSRSLLFSIIWFAYLSLSKRVENTYPKSQRVSKPIDQFVFGVILLFPIVIFVLGFIGDKTIADNSSQQEIPNTASLIEKTVRDFKNSVTLPYQVDEITSIIDVTAQPNAVRYHYLLSGVDTSKLTNDFLKNYLKPNLCNASGTKDILDLGINLEYSYAVKDSQEKYFVIISKKDCL
jgi:hypothetical protein